MDVKPLGQILGTFMPIVRLDEKSNYYLLGTKVQQLQMRGSKCMVTVGGGFVSIQEYYDKYSLSQCVSIHRMMIAQDLAFNGVIVRLLQQKNKNGKFKEVDEILKTYSEQDSANWVKTNDAFMTVAGYVDEKMLEKNQRASVKRNHE